MSEKNTNAPLQEESASENRIIRDARTPLRHDAFALSDAEKIEQIQKHFKAIMAVLGLDLRDDSLRGTPRRVAKMYVEEIFSGLHPDRFPTPSTFLNKYRYEALLIEKNITVYSTCEHHFLPIVGKAHVGYRSNGRVIGLSKINRIVDYYAKRPQVQERLTLQIVETLQKALNTADVACVIDAKHLCVNSRGVSHTDSSTVTAEWGGIFKTDRNARREFLAYVQLDKAFKS